MLDTAPELVPLSPSDLQGHSAELVLLEERPKLVESVAAVPLCIITGWLGAGKTTLVSHLLAHFGSQGKKIAVVQNEGTAMGVEDALRLQDDSGLFGEILELANGCVCCSIKSDFALALETLVKKAKFDYIFLECSGLADAGPLARMFWVDEELESNIYLDSIVTVVDAKFLESHLHDHLPHSRQVVRQIAFADRIVLNKVDLVSSENLTNLMARLHAINSTAQICTTHRSQVIIDDILYVSAFEAADAVKKSSLATPHMAVIDQDDHFHDHSITSLVLEGGEVDVKAMRQWLADLLWVYEGESQENASTDRPNAKDLGMEIFRMKALLAVSGETQQYFLQGVQELFELNPGSSSWPKNITPYSKMIVIGRNLDSAYLRKGFAACASATEDKATESKLDR